MRQSTSPGVCPYAVTRFALLALCGSGLLSQTLSHRPAGHITVAVVDSASVPRGTLTHAEQVAGRILECAGVAVTWAEVDVAVQAEMPAYDLILRVVPGAGPLRDPGTIGAALASDEGGVYASIFFDRVRARASDPSFSGAGVEVGPFMGHAIAHEIGHLLLGPDSHSRSGLMSAFWRTADLGRMSKGRFHFQPSEAARMHSEVERRNSESLRAAVAQIH